MNNFKKNVHTLNIKEAKERKILTKYENAKIKSIFVTHFSQGFFEDKLKNANNIKTAEDAYKYIKNQNKLPYDIEREYPNGHIQVISSNNI